MAEQARSLNQVVDFFSVAAYRDQNPANESAPVNERATPDSGSSSSSRASDMHDDEWEDF